MLKKTILKIVSAVLCVCMLLTAVLQSGITYAAGSDASLVIDESQIFGQYELDLTQAGDIDWMHFKDNGSGGVIEVTKATTPGAIAFNILPNSVPEGKMSNGDPDRVAKTWTDGMAGYESGSNDTGFAVLLPPAGMRGEGPCSSNVGWNFSVAPQPVETSVIFTVGLWQANAAVNFYINGMPADTKTITAGGSAKTFKYQVTVPANKALRVEGIQTDILSNDGNSSISSIAVGTAGTGGTKTLNILQNQVSGEGEINLSSAGNVDWLHLKGDSSGNIVHIKKATSPGTISFGTLSNTSSEGKIDNGDADHMSYSWNDGMAGYETGSKDTGFGVFFPKTERGPAAWLNNDVGCTFTAAPQPKESTVVFSLGLWQAKVDVKFYVDSALYDTKNISAGGGAQVYKYEVTVPANTELKVEGIQKETLSQWGNFSLSGIAVSSEMAIDKTALQTLYDGVRDLVQGSYTDATWAVFDSARIAAKAVLDDPTPTQSAIDSAKTALVQAKAALEYNTNELGITQSQMSGVYAIDLTTVGNVDWLHLKGDGSNGIIQIKKNTQNAISFSALANTVPEGKEVNGDANRASASWTDGMTGYESLANDTGFGVFLPLADDRNAGACRENVGWNFTVAAQPTPTTVIFSTGIWQAKTDVNFYLDGNYAAAKHMEAGGTAQVFKYQVVVPANKVLKVEGVQKYKNARDGNSSLSNIAVSSKEIADKTALQAVYNEFSGITKSYFTDDSWNKFNNAKIAAQAILEKVDATQADADNAKAALIQAQNELVKKVTNVMIDYTSDQRVLSYALGHLVDQQDRYQTFTSSEAFRMEYVQLGLTKASDDGSDLVVKLYETDSSGLPAGPVLVQTTVSKKDVISGGLTTAKLEYDISANKRYAIDVTQTDLQDGIYCWTVMPKNYYTKNEYYGKTNSGNFVAEAWLGTGFMKIIKKVSVDRSALEALVSEISNCNEKIYTVESWLAVTDASESARTCLNNFDATQQEIDAETGKLQIAKDKLVININISDFNALISDFDNVAVTGYTSASVAVLTGAIANAKQLSSNASDDEKLQAYSAVLNAIAKLEVSGEYSSKTDPGLTGSFGFESDMNAPIAFIDGSFKVVSRGNLMIRFGVTGLKAKGVSIDWYNRDGYLPCYVSEYTVDNVDYKIEEFANKHIIDGNPVEVAYAKMTATNNSGEKRLLPVVSKELLPLNEAAESSFVINDGETVVREYAIKADRFENEGHTGNQHEVIPKVEFPTDQKIVEAARLVTDTGKNSIFENNYADMKNYWDTRLAGIIDIKLPNSKDANNRDSLVNAYKAGYIYTLIIKDNTFLHIGENGYDRLFSHDTIGVLQTLITAGDFKDAKNYLESVPMTGGINIENGKVDPDLYWDANWKLPWAYSVYLSKTGDLDYIKTKFEGVIKKMAHSIHDDRTGSNHTGIMKSTLAIDSYGQWTVDDQAALMGLTAYKYICNELAIKETDQSKKDYYLAEVQWANAEYDSLLKVVTETLENTISSNNLNYIPASIVEPNTKNRCNDIRDANWASMLLFGSYPWDGHLYGADQTNAGANIDMIDQTYAYGIERRKNLPEASPYNFGGYPHGFYSSAYNAGYGIAALRGEAYRDMGIKAYEFQINSAMSSPFGWWEGAGPTDFSDLRPDPSSPLWNRDNVLGGGGSCQHMWGQATASKVLYDALVAERVFNDNKNVEIIIGRGVPKEWVTNATTGNNIVAAVENYPVLQGARAGYTIERNGSKLKITLNCDKENAKVDANTVEQWSIQLPSMVNNISAVSAGVVDNANGIVTVPLETKEVTIVLTDLLGSSVSIVPTALPNGKVGAAYSSALSAAGGTLPYTWSAEGLPTGLKITNAGVIEGTPAAEGTFSVNLKVQDSSSPALKDSITLSITIAPEDDPGSPVSIYTTALPNGKIGVAYSSTLAATGGTLPYTWSAEGLPTGLSITNTGVIEGTPAITGTFNVNLKVQDSSSPVLSVSKTLNITIAPADQPGGNNGNNGGNSSGGSSGNNSGNTASGSTGQTVNPVNSTRSGDNTILTVSIKANNVSGEAVANVDKATIANLVEKAKEAEKNGQNAIVEIKLDSAKDTKSVEIGLPADALKEIAGTVGTAIKISTGIGSVILDAEAIDSISASAASGNVSIIINKADTSSLSEEIKAKVGDRPVYGFSVQAGDKVISELDEGTAVVSIPYTPKSNEKENSIIIYEIDKDGNTKVVRSKYNPATGTVDFVTNDSAQYAVGYNEVKFKDVTSKDWFDKAVGFMSARGIVNGVGDGNFAPQNKVTRADFLVMVMNAYGIEVDKAVTDNFADAGNKYYTAYLGTAKRLGLVSGTGDNKFTPNDTISRQDMLVILYRALNTLGELPTAKTGDFESFSDTKDISGYAKDTMKLFVEAGIVGGDNKKLNPKDYTSRAEAVQVLYNLLSR